MKAQHGPGWARKRAYVPYSEYSVNRASMNASHHARPLPSSNSNTSLPSTTSMTFGSNVCRAGNPLAEARRGSAIASSSTQSSPLPYPPIRTAATDRRSGDISRSWGEQKEVSCDTGDGAFDRRQPGRSQLQELLKGPPRQPRLVTPMSSEPEPWRSTAHWSEGPASQRRRKYVVDSQHLDALVGGIQIGPRIIACIYHHQMPDIAAEVPKGCPQQAKAVDDHACRSA